MGKLDPISGHCRHIDPAFIKQRKEKSPHSLLITILDGSCNLCQAEDDPKHLAFPLCFSTTTYSCGVPYSIVIPLHNQQSLLTRAIIRVFSLEAPIRLLLLVTSAAATVNPLSHVLRMIPPVSRPRR